MPCIIQLGRQPYLFPWDSRVFDPLPNFMLIPIRQCRVDVSIPFLESNFHSIANFIRLALPGAKANGWDLVAGIEGKGFPISRQIQSRSRRNDGR